MYGEYCGQCKEYTLPDSQDITPDWEFIPEKFSWVSIDESGNEFTYVYKPELLFEKGIWSGDKLLVTGRVFDMTSIDWTKTLSERPK